MKRVTFIIRGQEFTYNDYHEDMTYEKVDPISKEEALKLLRTTKKLFDVKGIKFGLCFGTLLGAIRDNGIIKGDEDVDVYTSQEELVFQNLPFFRENGLEVIRVCKGSLYSFRMDTNNYIDVYIKRPLNDGLWGIWLDALEDKGVPKKLINEYEPIEFLGDTYFAPKDPERLIEFFYGKNWRTPVRGHKFLYEAPAYYYYKKWKSDFHIWFAQKVIHNIMIFIGLRKK